jgi:ribosomal protein S12 methylthiotransferase accessory factor
VRRLGEAGYQVTLVDATTDNGIPAMVAAMRNPAPGGLPVVFSASAALDPEEAARKCLEELAHTERYMWQIFRTVPDIPSRADHADVVDQVSHLRWWTVPERLHHASFVWASDTWRDFGELPSLATGNPRRDLNTMVERIAATGYRPLVRDLTTADVAGAGLRVVSCAIPGYHPLHMGHSVRALGGRRLYEVPGRLGHPAPSGPDDLNPYPHPFP